MRTPKPYNDLSLSELADLVEELAQSESTGRMEINMALAEVGERLSHRQKDGGAQQLESLRDTLLRLLVQGDIQRMGEFPLVVDLGSVSEGTCMCSIARLETRRGGLPGHQTPS